MKNSKIYMLMILLGMGVVSCTTDFEDINKNNNAPEDVTAQLLLPDIQRDMINQIMGESWGIGNIVIQHTAKNQFVNEDRYLWGEINGIWNTSYAKLRDVENMIKFADAAGDNGTKAVAQIMKAWIFTLLTDAYGDVPYSDATTAKNGNFYPKYDSQEAIYTGIIEQLKSANDLLATASGRVGGDLIFGGDLTKWRKLANSLRVRALMRISNKKSPAADLAAMIANPSQFPLFAGNADNATYAYVAASPDQFPLYNARSGSFNEFRASKTLLDTLVGLKDPRLTIFFRETPATEGVANKVYIGIPNGLDDVTAQTFAGGQQNHSRVSAIYYENAISSQGLSIARGVIMTFAELQFLLAEAAAKGFIATDGKTYYENGVKASMEFYGLAVPATYLSQPQVAYGTTRDQNLQKIALQKWVGLFYQGLEAWFDWRRTRLPVLKPAVSNQNNGRIPVRFIYPIIEQGLNAENRKAAVDRMGGDDINTLMWYLK